VGRSRVKAGDGEVVSQFGCYFFVVSSTQEKFYVNEDVK
jgi:hypothetical protein